MRRPLRRPARRITENDYVWTQFHPDNQILPVGMRSSRRLTYHGTALRRPSSFHMLVTSAIITGLGLGQHVRAAGARLSRHLRRVGDGEFRARQLR